MAGAIRRAVVKQQPIKRVRTAALPVYHAHGCKKCGVRYADSCKTPYVNAMCMTCTHGHDISVERKDRLPKDCCKAHSTVIRDADTLTRYGLGGDGEWWQCVGAHGCFRTHPYDPTKERT